MKRFIALALAASIVALPSAAVAGKGQNKGKDKAKGAHSAKGHEAKSMKSKGHGHSKGSKFGKSSSTGFGGAYRSEGGAPVCDPAFDNLGNALPVMCAATATGDVVGALGKGTITLSYNYTWDGVVADDSGVRCTTPFGGDAAIVADRGDLNGTIVPETSQVCESAEGLSYSFNFTLPAGDVVKGRESTGGTMTLRGEVPADGTTARGSFSGKASF